MGQTRDQESKKTDTLVSQAMKSFQLFWIFPIGSFINAFLANNSAALHQLHQRLENKKDLVGLISKKSELEDNIIRDELTPREICFIGLVYFLEKKYQDALSYLNRVNADLDAKYLLAVMYENGWHVAEDKQKAENLYFSAASAGHPMANFYFGKEYEQKKDEKLMIRYYKKSADGAHPGALLKLAEIDRGNALQYQIQAMRHGSVDAFHSLKNYLKKYYFDQGDFENILQFYGLLAERFDVSALCILGSVYAGAGLNQSLKEACRILQFGKTDDQENLWALYENGALHMIKPNLGIAAVFYRNAVEKTDMLGGPEQRDWYNTLYDNLWYLYKIGKITRCSEYEKKYAIYQTAITLSYLNQKINVNTMMDDFSEYEKFFIKMSKKFNVMISDKKLSPVFHEMMHGEPREIIFSLLNQKNQVAYKEYELYLTERDKEVKKVSQFSGGVAGIVLSYLEEKPQFECAAVADLLVEKAVADIHALTVSGREHSFFARIFSLFHREDAMEQKKEEKEMFKFKNK